MLCIARVCAIDLNILLLMFFIQHPPPRARSHPDSTESLAMKDHRPVAVIGDASALAGATFPPSVVRGRQLLSQSFLHQASRILDITEHYVSQHYFCPSI